MSTEDKHDDWEDAEQVVAELRSALDGVGVVLPSVSVDLQSAVAGYPLVNLGRVNVATARALIKVLTRERAAKHP